MHAHEDAIEHGYAHAHACAHAHVHIFALYAPNHAFSSLANSFKGSFPVAVPNLS